jgi:hypothetical protein
MTSKPGFLMVAMEPPAGLEEEFNDWYDTEHVPERVAIDGFLSARRFVCLKGWPRYLAIYDLRSPGVIDEPGYAAISGENFTPWSKRILARVRGLWRAHGEQVYAGAKPSGPMARMLFIRFRDVPVSSEVDLIDRVRQSFEGRSEVLQVKVVRNEAAAAGEYAALIEMSASQGAETPISELGSFASHIDILNTYAPYWYRGSIRGLTLN